MRLFLGIISSVTIALKHQSGFPLLSRALLGGLLALAVGSLFLAPAVYHSGSYPIRGFWVRALQEVSPFWRCRSL